MKFGITMRQATEAVDAFSKAFNEATTPKPERKEWKLSEAISGFYETVNRATCYTFPDGTRYMLGDERKESEDWRNIRVPAKPPQPIETGSLKCSMTQAHIGNVATATGRLTYSPVHWGSTSLPPDIKPSKPTKWSTTNLGAHEWLKQRVDEVVEMGRLATARASSVEIAAASLRNVIEKCGVTDYEMGALRSYWGSST